MFLCAAFPRVPSTNLENIPKSSPTDKIDAIGVAATRIHRQILMESLFMPIILPIWHSLWSMNSYRLQTFAIIEFSFSKSAMITSSQLTVESISNIIVSTSTFITSLCIYTYACSISRVTFLSLSRFDISHVITIKYCWQ